MNTLRRPITRRFSPNIWPLDCGCPHRLRTWLCSCLFPNLRSTPGSQGKSSMKELKSLTISCKFSNTLCYCKDLLSVGVWRIPSTFSSFSSPSYRHRILAKAWQKMEPSSLRRRYWNCTSVTLKKEYMTIYIIKFNQIYASSILSQPETTLNKWQKNKNKSSLWPQRESQSLLKKNSKKTSI